VQGTFKPQHITFYVSILHIMQLAPQKLSAELKNRPGAEGAGAWPEDQRLQGRRRAGRRRYQEGPLLEQICFLTQHFRSLPQGWLGTYALGSSYIALPWLCGHAMFSASTITPQEVACYIYIYIFFEILHNIQLSDADIYLSIHKPIMH